MNGLRLFPRPQMDDPGDAWADTLLSDLRRETLDIDITRRVMVRLETFRPAPAPRPLPGRWPGIAWAASLALGCLCLLLLTATLGAMVISGDEGARATGAVLSSAGHLAWGMLGRLWLLVTAFLSASLALLRGVFTLLDTLAPVMRGAGALAAIAGVLSIACSAYIFDRARRGAPIADQRHTDPIPGGFS